MSVGGQYTRPEDLIESRLYTRGPGGSYWGTVLWRNPANKMYISCIFNSNHNNVYAVSKWLETARHDATGCSIGGMMLRTGRFRVRLSLMQAAVFVVQASLVLGLALQSGSGDAWAQDAKKGEVEARIARGLAIAAENCSACHAIGLDDESPTRVNENTAFRQLHERYPIAMLEEAAQTGKISGHDEMPEFQFEPEDAKALLTYIDTLAPDQPGYMR